VVKPYLKALGTNGKLFGWMLNLYRKKTTSAVDTELPFAAMMLTLMAASGVTLYESWKKMRDVNLLPVMQKDAEEMVRQVEVLGRDPLTVMYKKSEQTKSKSYRDLLAGYVSAVRSGGNVVDLLRSKLRSIFEQQSAASVRSIEKLGTLVEAYSVLLIVTLCTYILYVVMSATSLYDTLRGGRAMGPATTQPLMYIAVLLAMPGLSLVFMAIAHMSRKSSLINMGGLYRRALLLLAGAAVFFLLIALVPSLQSALDTVGLPLVVAICLAVVSLPPAISYYRIAKTNYAAEEAMPSFLRDVTEARKIGLSPEKSIIHASKRTGYGRFSELLGLVRSQIEWGVSLKKIFGNIRKKIQSWPVLVHFFILVETIEIGGGSSEALEILAEYSEKNRDIEANKRSMLMPYVILAFVWSVLIAFTTTIVALTIFILAQVSLPNLSTATFVSMQQQISLFSVGIIFQCWLSGFFVGKIREGAFAAGFKYAAFLAITAYLSLVFSRSFLEGLYRMPA
jgi:flagellar protein FlaJ